MSELHSFIAENQPNICQISSFKAGHEVYSDQWHGYQKDDSCHVMSVTKSIAALLVGIALDQGLIKDIDEPVLSFFPDYRVKRGEKTIQKVTVKHLLTMTAPYKYKYEPWTKICSGEDWTAAALDFLGGRAGLTGSFKYSTLGVHILTGIIAEASGMKTVDFANRYLFEPLGIKPRRNYMAKTAEEHKAFIISRAPKDPVWFCDSRGTAAAGFGLCLSASDGARIGRLCLNKGVWEGKRILPSWWIEEMTTPGRRCGREFGNMSYGYLWWVPDPERGDYLASGTGGNVIYVSPGSQTVVAVTSYFKANVFDRLDFIKRYILPRLDE